MKILMTAIFLTSLFCFTFAQAQQTTFEKAPLHKAYIPLGFDNINRVQITVEGVFPNSCFRVGAHKVQVSGNKIIVTQGAYRYKGVCADIVIPYNEVVDLGILNVGDYEVVDGTSGNTLGALPVVQAPQKPASTYPDDYLYAPVSDASLVRLGEQSRVILTGAFTDNCTRFIEIRARVYGNVIEVLPITKRATTGCTRGLHPFQVNRAVSAPNGHYLLYVRSLSGNAINKLVDLY